MPSWYHHHHHISDMELGHLLTHSSVTYPEVSLKVCHDSFCQLGNSVSLPWVIYRVNIKSFADYKHLLQENYLEYKHFFLNVTQLKTFLEINLSNGKKICILVINVCNQGKTLCSPCVTIYSCP